MKSEFNLNNYVSVIKNNSTTYTPEDIVNVCKRKNNPKRDFLFVNSLQGKHLHVAPSKIFDLYDELVLSIMNSICSDEKIVVIGFAETATAIGHYIASSLPNCSYYMQTTRELIPGAMPLLEFKEEHSHATEQFLYGSQSELFQCDRIIFVDDEISTGKTVLNFIYAIEELGVRAKYGVASILNWQNDMWSNNFESLNIDTYFVLRGKLKNLDAKVPVSSAYEIDQLLYTTPSLPKIIEVKSDFSNFDKERIGSTPYNLSEFAENIYAQVSAKLDKLPSPGENVLVLGTEEYMFAPMVIGKMLSEERNVNVQFHATTRSPIVSSPLSGYAIKTSYPITSCYDSIRNTFVYNLEYYDKVYIITDVTPTLDFQRDISTALTSVGCQIENITIITMKG